MSTTERGAGRARLPRKEGGKGGNEKGEIGEGIKGTYSGQGRSHERNGEGVGCARLPCGFGQRLDQPVSGYSILNAVLCYLNLRVVSAMLASG